MTCELEPLRVCKSCEAGGDCAYRLILDARDLAALARIERIRGYGEARPVNLSATPMQREAKREVEPMGGIACTKCGRLFEAFAYLVEFLALRGVGIKCEACR